MGNLVEYGGYSEEEADRDAEDFDRSGSDFYKWKNGKNIVRILPPLPGKPLFVSVWRHFIELPGKKQSIVCAKMTAKKQCGVCDFISDLERSQSRRDQKAAKAMQARRRVYCNIIDRTDEEAGPQVMVFGSSIAKDLANIRRDAGGDFTNPKKGFDITIRKSGSGMQTEYKTTPHASTSKLSDTEDQINEWIIGQDSNLEKHKALPDPKVVRGLLSGGDDDEDEDEEEEEENAPRRTKPVKRRAAAEDDDDEEDEKPTRRAKSTDDDEDEPPKKKRRTIDDDANAIDTEGYEVEE